MKPSLPLISLLGVLLAFSAPAAIAQDSTNFPTMGFVDRVDPAH